MKALMVRNLKTGQFYIEVTLPTGKKELWETIIEHCAEGFSNNELKIIYDKCNKQLLEMNADDVPQTFKHMMDRLREVIINRKAYGGAVE